VDEITATLTLDGVLSTEMADCSQINSEHTKTMEILLAKKKEHYAVAQLRDKVWEYMPCQNDYKSFVYCYFMFDCSSIVYIIM
jgi:hypothetical protein